MPSANTPLGILDLLTLGLLLAFKSYQLRDGGIAGARLIDSEVQETEQMRQINSSDFRLNQSESSAKEDRVPCPSSAQLIRPVLVLMATKMILSLSSKAAEVAIETIESFNLIFCKQTLHNETKLILLPG